MVSALLALFIIQRATAQFDAAAWQEVASALLAPMAEARVSGPLAIGGIGYGAAIAHELACQVRSLANCSSGYGIDMAHESVQGQPRSTLRPVNHRLWCI